MAASSAQYIQAILWICRPSRETTITRPQDYTAGQAKWQHERGSLETYSQEEVMHLRLDQFARPSRLKIFAFMFLTLPIVFGLSASADEKKPNILVIFGDDIGLTNISAYGQGVVGYTTPNIDRLAKEGLQFIDYYAERTAVRLGAQPSSPGNPRSEQAYQRSVYRVQPLAYKPAISPLRRR